ncbi:MAG: hypothetical protein Q8R30_01795 [bacterium]|nr:hypothetical protein [bacterium]MDZ4285298.1 hypothetical protein [Candidatus Sungbacteria bacterium]
MKKRLGNYTLKRLHLQSATLSVAVSIVVFLAGGILFFSGQHALWNSMLQGSAPYVGASQQPGISTISHLRAYMQERVDRIGSKGAYEELKRDYAERRFEDQHTAAHLFGELLYQKEGIHGVTFCDELFAFGCYHGFFGTALSREGVGMIKELDRACVEKFGTATGCQHGIGHGLMEYFGRGNLVAALRGCEQTTQKNPLHGCSSGVFMDYNEPVIFSGNNVNSSIRALNRDNPHEPCNTVVPEKFRSSCYFEIGLWWKHTLGDDYGKLGELCRQVHDKEQRTSCYLGLGNVAASSSEYDTAATIASCEKMSKAEGEMYCRVGAALRLLGTDTHGLDASRMCAYPDASRENECRHLVAAP